MSSFEILNLKRRLQETKPGIMKQNLTIFLNKSLMYSLKIDLIICLFIQSAFIKDLSVLGVIQSTREMYKWDVLHDLKRIRVSVLLWPKCKLKITMQWINCYWRCEESTAIGAQISMVLVRNYSCKFPGVLERRPLRIAGRFNSSDVSTVT